VKVTILGITGGVGHAVAQAFVAAGHEVRALVRSPDKVVDATGVELLVGDARDPSALTAALAGADVVFHGLNLPYPDWDPGMIELTRAVLDAATAQGVTVLFPGNVYGLGPDYAEPMAEDARHEPTTRKGRLRNRLERMLAQADVPTIVLRMGDFFGGIGQSSWMYHLTDGTLRGAALSYGGDRNVLHSWAYLPDAAATFVQLAERRRELDPHEVFHFEGHVVDGHSWVEAARRALGDPDRRVRAFPWFWMNFGRPFSPMVRELFEMRYLWQEPVRMRQDKLVALLGDVPHTPFDEAMRTALLPAPASRAA